MKILYIKTLSAVIFLLIILLPGIYEESNLGLLALRETYLDDPETTSQLDELILGFQKTGRRIETEIENLMSKLSEHL